MSFCSRPQCSLLSTTGNVVADVLRGMVKGLCALTPYAWFMPLIFCTNVTHAQTNEWTWMGGDLATGSFGAYGTLATSGPTNRPGGRTQPVTWTDNQGNLWLFGGEGFDSAGNPGYLNDLWEFHPTTGEWVWMSGSSNLGSSFDFGVGVYGVLGTPAAGNIPPGRSGAVSWTDAKGNLWLFGGFNYSVNGPNYFNDLWEYTPSTSEWTWISGSNLPNQHGIYRTLGAPADGNIPGARNNAVTWTDGKGNLRLFGGTGYDSAGNLGNLNDLWEFNPSTKQWTWVNGANTVNQLPVTGTLGTPAIGNVPAARNNAIGWTDNKGNFWLFGGFGINTAGGSAIGSSLNDLWEYNPATNEWAWISGTSITTSYISGQAGIYGTLQISEASNTPGSRTGGLSWVDKQGNLWLFGGVGWDATNAQGLLNDLWQFNPSKNEWTWMGGSNSLIGFCPILSNWCGQLGVYGTEKLAALGNSPGGRYNGASWTDSNGNFWLFGGLGIDSQGNGGYLNDLWEFQPNTGGSSPVASTPFISLASGTYTSWQTIIIDDTTPGATIEYLINGIPPALEYTGPIMVSSTETIAAIAKATGYANSNIATASYKMDLSVAATPTFSVTPGTYTTTQTVTISDTTPGAVIYYAIGPSPATPNIPYSGPINISSSETLRAMAVSQNYLNSAVAVGVYVIGQNPSGQWTWMGGSKLIPSACSNKGGCGAAGWYGTLGLPAPSNFPGARRSASTWTDSNGNLWLFGGAGYDATGSSGYLNDLWKFSPATGLWTWMSGGNTVTCIASSGCGTKGVYGTLNTPGAANTPGGRGSSVHWMDSSGRLWLFGGMGFDSAGTYGLLNDLWRFDSSTNEWTWMGGSNVVPCLSCGQPGQYGTFETAASGNIPGGRGGGAYWKDHSGNFWLFGGLGHDSRGLQGYLNDLWKFNPSTNEWAWMGGSKFIAGPEAGLPGIYGDLGVPALGNIPWSLQYPASWTDNDGNLRLFGGLGEDTNAVGWYMNDMWAFYPSLKEWAWTSPNSGGAVGVYGTLGVFASANIPGVREDSASWTDANGNFWVLGGTGVENGSLEIGWLNDLWEFNSSMNQWRWMGGSNSIPFEKWGAPGQYGTLGMPASDNTPGGRTGSATWTDTNGNLWLFGGSVFDAQGKQGTGNDLWEYTLGGTSIVALPTPAAAPVFSLAAGTYDSVQTLTITAQTSGSTIYYTTNGTSPSVNSPVYTGPISVSASETVQAVAASSGYAISPTTSAAYYDQSSSSGNPNFQHPGWDIYLRTDSNNQ